MSQQTRSAAALTSALTEVKAAARAARNLDRLRTNRLLKPRDRVNLDHLINTLADIHSITSGLATTITHHAYAVRAHYGGGDWVTDDGTGITYPVAVVEAAAHTETVLTALADRLARTPTGPSQDALASLAVIVAQARQKAAQRRDTGQRHPPGR
jgi:hypothetical protein